MARKTAKTPPPRRQMTRVELARKLVARGMSDGSLAEAGFSAGEIAVARLDPPTTVEQSEARFRRHGVMEQVRHTGRTVSMEHQVSFEEEDAEKRVRDLTRRTR
jgi:hypothetical protein